VNDLKSLIFYLMIEFLSVSEELQTVIDSSYSMGH